MAKYAYRKGVWEKLMKEEEGIQEARRLVGHKESWGETLKRTSVNQLHNNSNKHTTIAYLFEILCQL